MSGSRILLLIAAVFLLIIAGLGAGVWWYLFGNNEIDSAELVPANTVFFASIPNAATLLAGYQSSQAKALLGTPNAKPMLDSITGLIGQKNLDLLNAFLPNLSGQSFVAVTHFDYDHPEKIGLIAAMKPKAGLGDFGTFLDKLKATWPEIIKQGTTGTSTVEGVSYDWIRGPGASDKICVAQYGGWIVTTWGEASLQDWIERYRRKSDTSSLAKDLNYVKSISRVGDNPMTLLYVNNHCLVEILQQHLEKTNPTAADYFANKLQNLGGAALATRFENGEIVDRFSFVYPRPAQIEAGMAEDPCPFETLKFTGPDTRFYWASAINWKQYAKKIHEQSRQTVAVNPVASNAADFVENWAHGAGLDTQQNIIDALGAEVSVQAEWPSDDTWPEVGLFVKLDKPDDFKPTIAAIINSVRQAYTNAGVIKELSVGGQKFATLQFIQASALSPTITEDGPYLGVFLNANQAVRSFQRNESIGLPHNPSFAQQVGDKRTGAAQVLFLDSPYLLNRAYTTAMPYLSIAEMFNKNIAGMLGGKTLPPDLTWLAPIGTWSCVITPDEEGIEGYSVSGIGNQGLFLSGGAGAAIGMLQSMGLLPKQAIPSGASLLSGPAPVAIPGAPTTPSTNAAASSAPVSNSVISITLANKIFFDDTPVPADQIADFLKAKKAANPDLKLVVHVDQDASPDTLSTVMDAGASAGFGVLSYVYTRGDSSLPVSTNAASAAPPMVAGTATNAPSGSPATNTSTNLPPLPSPTDATPATPAPAPPQ